nr:adenosylcobinamide amidohydrolase [Nitrospirota bacterium]
MTSRSPIETRFLVEGRTLLIDLEKRLKILSSAPCHGGLVRARYIMNHQVQANPVAAPAVSSGGKWTDPARYLKQVAGELGVVGEAVALMTAVPMKQLVTLREGADGLWVEGFVTVGVTNAVRAGDPVKAVKEERRAKPGTINIILVTNARLADSAMVGAVQVLTESKTATLLAAGVISWTGRQGATGTGTDAAVIACGAGRNGPRLRYSGTHTKMGELIGRLVMRGVNEGLKRSERWLKQPPARDNR